MTTTLILYKPARNPHGGFPRQKEARREACGSIDAAIRQAYAIRRDMGCPYTKVQVIDQDGRVVRDHEYFDGAWRNQLPKEGR